MNESQKIKFTPTKPDGISKYRPIVAYTIPDMPGLCVHRLRFWHDNDNPYDWGVSHIESGAIISHSLDFTKEGSIKIVKDMYSHINFTRSFKEVNKYTEEQKIVKLQLKEKRYNLIKQIRNANMDDVPLEDLEKIIELIG